MVKARSLHHRGASSRAIHAKLAAKGVDKSAIQKALVALEEEDPDPEFTAAITFARKRHIGPFRRGPRSRTAPEDQKVREKELASMGRAGFCFDMARRIVDAGSEKLLSSDERFI
jgi:regulatory protein